MTHDGLLKPQRAVQQKEKVISKLFAYIANNKT